MKDTEGQGRHAQNSLIYPEHHGTLLFPGHIFLLSLSFAFRKMGVKISTIHRGKHTPAGVLRPWREHQFHQRSSKGTLSL